MYHIGRYLSGSERYDSGLHDEWVHIEMCENKRCGKDLRKAGFKTLDEVVLTERQGQQRVYCSAACSAELKEVA